MILGCKSPLNSLPLLSISQLKGAKQRNCNGWFCPDRQALDRGVVPVLFLNVPQSPITPSPLIQNLDWVNSKVWSWEEDATIAIGMKKGDTRIDQCAA